VFDLQGNFSQTAGCNADSFAASGTHQVVLNGTAAQTVAFSCPGSATTQSHFQNLQITNTAGVNFSSAAFVNGNLDVPVAATVSGSSVLTVAGNVTTAANSSITVPLTLTGSTLSPSTTFPASNINIGASTTLNTDTTITGNLTLSAPFDLNGHNLTVQGALAVVPGGTLRMQNANGVVTVNGAATFSGAGENGLLSAGVFNLKGNFSQTNGCNSDGFAASGTHQVVLNGTAAQTVAFNCVGTAANQSHFQNLQITNAAGISFTTNADVNGNLDIPAAVTLSGSANVIVAGNVTMASNSNINVSTLTLSGSPLSPSSILTVTNLVLTGGGVFNTDTTVTGNVTINGNMDVNGHNITIQGNLTAASGGRLFMQNPAGVLTVSGNATFSSNGENNLLTAGVLNLKGNFSQTAGCNSDGFAASGTHQVVLNGTTAQTIAFSCVGTSTSTSHFQNLQVANAAGINFTTNADINGNLDIPSTATLSGGFNVTVAGNVTMVSGSNINLSTLTLSGSALSPSSTFTVSNLAITGAAVFNTDTTITGGVLISGSMDVNGHTLSILGGLTAVSGGLLKMQNPAGVLTVGGNATFAGSGENGLLTAGTLNFKGNFSQTAGCNSDGYAASGTHRTVFNGTGAQTIAFTCTTASHFQDFEVANASGAGVTLTTSAVANGSLIVAAGATKNLVGGGNTLTVFGLNVNNLALNNVLLAAQTTAATLTSFNSVSFSNYAPTATQFTIANPGAASAFTFSNLVFNSVPSTGFYISATDNQADANVFTITLVSPTSQTKTFQVSGGAVINWP
jgi:hypothetical protein